MKNNMKNQPQDKLIEIKKDFELLQKQIEQKDWVGLLMSLPVTHSKVLQALTTERQREEEMVREEREKTKRILNDSNAEVSVNCPRCDYEIDISSIVRHERTITSPNKTL